MTPSARLQAAIDLLDELERSNQPADRFMREFFRARRYAGSKDRAAVGERVYAILRHPIFVMAGLDPAIHLGEGSVSFHNAAHASIVRSP